MTKFTIVLSLSLFVSTSGWSEDIAKPVQLEESHFEIGVVGQGPPIKTIGGTCTIAPYKNGDRQLSDRHITSDNVIPKEIYDIMKDRDADGCPDHTDVHQYHVECKKIGKEQFDLKVSRTDPATGGRPEVRIEEDWIIQFSGGEISALKYTSETYVSGLHVATKKMSCGNLPTS